MIIISGGRTMESAYSSVPNLLEGTNDGDVSAKPRLAEVLDIRLAEIRDLTVVRHGPLSSSSSTTSTSSGTERSVFCVVKLDREEVFRSSAVARTQNPCFGDDFHLEVPRNFTCLSFFVYDQIPNRVARPIGRVTLRKQDLAKYSGSDRCWRLKPMSRHSDVTGKVWLEVTRTLTHFGAGSNAATSVAGATVGDFLAGQSLSVRVLDYCDLNHVRSNDLYAVVCLQYKDGAAETKKLRMRRRQPPPPGGSNNGADQSSIALCSHEAATFALKACQHNDYFAENPLEWLRISVWHDILGSFTSYFHGEVRIRADTFGNKQNGAPQEPFRAWYSLSPRANTNTGTTTTNNNNTTTLHDSSLAASTMSPPTSGNSKDCDYLGSLRLKITYNIDHILPTQCYNELWAQMLDALSVQPFRCSVAGLVAALPRTDLEHAARPLIRIFLHSEKLRPLMRILCAEEIAQCQDVNTLFRSSSMASKCIYELMKLVGQQYLISTLKPVVDKIFAERRSCEIDPDRVPPGANIEENAAHLILYTEQALSRILDSTHRCPTILKDVFRILRETTERYHPNDQAVQWLALSSFLIMRFFAAALLNPKLFWLKRENPDVTVQRTLALISKIIQRLSNFVVVGRTLTEKEPFLTPIFERFADENHRLGFTKFFDRISCVGGENSITGESVTVLKEGLLHERIPKKNKKVLNLSADQLDSSCSSSSSSSSSSLCFHLRNVFQRSASKPRLCCLTETDFCWYKEKGQTLIGRIALTDVKIAQPAEEVFGNELVLEIRSERHCVYLEAANKVDLGEWILALQRACKRQRLTQQQLTENAAQMYEIDIAQQLETIHMIFLENYEVLSAWRDNLGEGMPLPTGVTSCEGYLNNVDSSGRNTFYNSLTQILECVMTLEGKHLNHFRQIQYGSKDMPIGEDNYLLLGSRMRDYVAVCAGKGVDNDKADRRSSVPVEESEKSLHAAIAAAAASSLPPKSATAVALLHYPTPPPS